MDSQFNFLIIIVLVLIAIKLFYQKENFTNCSKFSNDYNQCYNNNCTVMIDLEGNSFCTNK